LPHSFYPAIDSFLVKDLAQSVAGDVPIMVLFSSFLGKIPKIIFFLAIKRALESTKELFNPIQDLVKSAVRASTYTKKIYEQKDATALEFYLCVSLKNEEKNLNGLTPQVFLTEANSQLTLHYIPFFHAKEITRIEQIGKDRFEEYLKNVSGRVSYKVLRCNSDKVNYESAAFSKLYPSANYIRLSKMIKRHFDVSSITGINNVLGVLVDGEPGLGKTKFADFAAEHVVAQNIYKADLSGLVEINFDVIMTAMYSAVTVERKTIFLIDELDKYVDYRLAQIFVLPEMEDREEVVNREKQRILYKILRVLERDVPHPVVVIFCSNNFSSIFEGVDMTHHKSLLSRFMKVEFERCDREELADYVYHYNEKFSGTDYYEDVSHSEIRKRIKEDASLTYRQLYQISIRANYELEETIRLINEGKLEDIVVEPLPVEKEVKVVKKEPVEKEVKVVKKEPVEKEVKEPNPSDSDSDSDEVPIKMKITATKQEPVETARPDKWKSYVALANARDGVREEKNGHVKEILKIFNKMEECSVLDYTLTVVELFQYLAHNPSAHLIIDEAQGLFGVVKEKAMQIYEMSPEILVSCDEQTKQFLAAIAGR
jgi:MoxR-like ATPase